MREEDGTYTETKLNDIPFICYSTNNISQFVSLPSVLGSKGWLYCRNPGNVSLKLQAIPLNESPGHDSLLERCGGQNLGE